MKQEKIGLKIWRIIYPMGIYFGITQIISMVFIFAETFFMTFAYVQKGVEPNPNQLALEVTEKITGYTMYIMIISAIITIPILIMFYRKDKKRLFYQDERRAKMPLADYFLILILAVSSCIAFNNLISISSIAKYSEMYEKVSEAIYNSALWVQILAAGILAPIVEEILFRGLIYKRVKEYINPVAGMAISSVMFGLYHGNIVQGIYATLLGLIFVFLMEKYRTLKAPILAHMCANIFGIVLTGWKYLQKLFELNVVFISATIVGSVLVVIVILYLNKKEVEYIKNEEAAI